MGCNRIYNRITGGTSLHGDCSTDGRVRQLSMRYGMPLTMRANSRPLMLPEVRRSSLIHQITAGSYAQLIQYSAPRYTMCAPAVPHVVDVADNVLGGDPLR